MKEPQELIPPGTKPFSPVCFWAGIFSENHKIYSSTCHERTPSGPGKSVRTMQVAAHQRDGWARVTWPYTAGDCSRRGSPKAGTTVPSIAVRTVYVIEYASRLLSVFKFLCLGLVHRF